MLPKLWKKTFCNGIVIPTKMRQCNDCKDGIFCTLCNDQVDQNKKFEAKLNEIKRHPPNEFG